jgi:hypothetical protein
MSILIVLFLTLTSYAAPSPRFCERKNSDIHRELAEPKNRIEFKNGGGLLNGGVCWWHSRLQRSSLYLARFNPLRPKPNGAQIRGILSALKNMNQVVEIGGYANFHEFSKGEKPSVQSLLEAWQKEDGILYFQWIRGLSGKHRLPSRELEVRMDELAELVSSSPTPVWAMAQMKGITSHSFLIRTMEALPTGYKLELIDSNSPADLRYAHYQRGDQSLRLVEGRNEFVLYPGFQTDFKKMKSTLSEHCHWNPHSFLEENLFGHGPLIEGEIEPQDL